MEYKETGNWTANASGGDNSYTYQWQYRLAGSQNWSGTLGTNQSFSRLMWDYDFELRCIVTSIYGLTGTGYIYVYYDDGGPLPKQSADSTATAVVKQFHLAQNYPNPFNPGTTLEYTLNSDQLVELKVFDVLGREVKTLVNERQSAGEYKVLFNGGNLPSGIYYFQLRAGERVQRRKGLLLK